MRLELKFDGNLRVYQRKLDRLASSFPLAMPRIINQVGDKAKTQVTRSLTKQTGLKRATIVKAIGSPKRAHAGDLTYEMTTSGGNISLKYLEPRETRKGTSAKPWNSRRLYAGAFMKGGAFPNRKEVGKFDGHVYRRLNSSGTKITQVKSDMYIPTEMVKGETAAAFNKTAPLLKERVDKAIAKLL